MGHPNAKVWHTIARSDARVSDESIDYFPSIPYRAWRNKAVTFGFPAVVLSRFESTLPHANRTGIRAIDVSDNAKKA